MIKLLICDDEPWICSLLNRFIDYKGMGLTLLGYAYDGVSALEKILEAEPEIVITDIKMPGMDGLELISKVRDRGLPVRFVIVSGFGTFDYARQAIRYQVEDYLIKPIEREAVCEVIEKLCAAIRAEKESRGNLDRTLHDLEHSSLVARRYFLSNMIYNPAEITNKTLEHVNQEYRLAFHAGLFQLVLLNLVPLEKQMQASENIKKIELYLRSIFREKCMECESYIDRSCIILLLNYAPEDADEIEKMLRHYFKAMLNTPEYAGLFRMMLSIGKPFADFSGISASYLAVKALLPVGILKGYNCICLPPEDSEGTAPAPMLDASLTDALKGAVGRNSRIALYNALYEFFSAHKKSICAAPGAFPQLLQALLASIARLTETGEAQVQAVQGRIGEAYPGCGSLEELCDLLADEFFVFVETYHQLRSGERSLSVQAARQYIAQHYAQTLTLEAVANQVFLSPSHLSTLFKKELKMTFHDYLTEVRVKAAKHLLAKPMYSIAQVGEMVGYSDPKYFSRVFCKKVGLKPVEYRKLRAADMEVDVG